MRNGTESRASSRSLTIRLLLMAAGMLAFAVLALPPLYDVFCEVTGLGGKTNRSAALIAESPDQVREIKLEFVTTVNEYAPWEFRAETDGMTITPGALYEANFIARNLTGDLPRGRCGSR
jgi:cytochrome c oxidase assembly protein subunit 11